MTTFYNMVFADIKKMCTNSSSQHTNLGRLTLQSLAKNDEIIIKTADKGGGIVIQDRADYILEAERLLGDTATYEKLSQDPLPRFKIIKDTLVKTALRDNIITKKEASFMLKDFYNTPYFYHIPKIHKSTTHPPGRPIIAAIDTITSGLSKYIDYHLQPLAQGLCSYIQCRKYVFEHPAILQVLPLGNHGGV